MPVVIHVGCISSLNNIYKLIAEKLTVWENHETTVNHRNSLVLKRFLFEAYAFCLKHSIATWLSSTWHSTSVI